MYGTRSHGSVASSPALALDCEFVGKYSSTYGRSQSDHICSVAIVDERCCVVYSSLCDPGDDVADYRTWIHGLTFEDLWGAPSIQQVRSDVARIISGHLVVGSNVWKDLRVLNLDEGMPRHAVCNLAQLPYFNRGQAKTSLKALAYDFLGLTIQQGRHSAEEDALVSMQLYQLSRQQLW